MSYYEHALSFHCNDCWLYGILSIPTQPISRGILIVVGGPQYRVGSHRQFTLLARFLANKNIAAMRFDYRGMGDSDGEIRTFEDIEDDLKIAIDQFFINMPNLKEVVVWGLCDAASAALFYAHKDPRITGLILVNPWVRTEAGVAKAYLKHYYASRFLKWEFWKKILIGKFNIFDSFNALFRSVKNTLIKENEIPKETLQKNTCYLAPLPERMLEGLNRFAGKIYIITSGDDLTAQEFLDLIRVDKGWKEILKNKQVTYSYLKDANHTFSTREWRDQIAHWTIEWSKSW